MKTRFTELFGVEYPIMQGGMQWLGTPELAAAVSEAGGLGTINAAIYREPEEFSAAVREVKKRTSRPFCVNFSLVPDVEQGTYQEQLEIMVDEGVGIIETAGANPAQFVPFFKEHGLKWIHKAPTVKHALKGQELGADAVTVVGFEVGGHPGRDEISANVLVRHAAKLLDIPVMAAGGYADGHGLAAALAMGAEGITMGTRFIAVKECVCHENFKQWIVKARESDTCLVQKSLRNLMRAADNEAARTCIQLEAQGAPVSEILKICSGQVGRRCYETGDTQGSIFPVGQAVGLIDDIPSTAELIRSIVEEAQAAIARLAALA